jgi:hypothetical protein
VCTSLRAVAAGGVLADQYGNQQSKEHHGSEQVRFDCNLE